MGINLIPIFQLTSILIFNFFNLNPNLQLLRLQPQPSPQLQPQPSPQLQAFDLQQEILNFSLSSSLQIFNLQSTNLNFNPIFKPNLLDQERSDLIYRKKES